jgi:hypothetical protein
VCFRRGAPEPALGATVAKAVINEARPNGSQTEAPRGATMIAATAFAIVGIVVVAFLNRIP